MMSVAINLRVLYCQSRCPCVILNVPLTIERELISDCTHSLIQELLMDRFIPHLIVCDLQFDILTLTVYPKQKHCTDLVE